MKKNLIVLLLIPFLIALLGVVTISTTYTLVENDIKDMNVIGKYCYAISPFLE